MTEEQKLQWLQSLLAKGTQVGQINLGNGVQNIQINVQGQTAVSQDKPTESPSAVSDSFSTSDSSPAPTVPLAQSNIIFNPRIFTTESGYERLRQVILAFIRHDENSRNNVNDCDCGNEEYQIDAATQSEWYFILKAIGEAKVTGSGKLTDAAFLRQMWAWFPNLFIGREDCKNNEDKDKILRRYASSISAERKKWIVGLDHHEVSIRDMFAHSNARGYDRAKTLRLHGVAEGLRKRLEEISQ